MSFNLGISNHPISRLGGLSSIGVYLYEDIYYRQWITEVALAFYEGRQDEFENKRTHNKKINNYTGLA